MRQGDFDFFAAVSQVDRLAFVDHAVGDVAPIDQIWGGLVAEDISEETAEVFAKGIYFGYEDTTTGPAQLEILDGRRARLTIYEGKYHQVKRMFHAVENRVVSLHREKVGSIELDPGLKEGEWRELLPEEI